MSIARKMFIGRVLIPGGPGVSLLSMMQASALHWGLEADLSTPSLDSIIGSECIGVPDGAIRISSDSANAATGIAKAAAATFSLSDYGPDFGIIDPTAIFFYSVNPSGTGMDLTFTAR
jgi:hypothetical protein